ncbi:tellurite resistance TerB family protein [Scandinavium goeteborgense]|jgi:tellurite resistance protein TerB|uniref:tellurite resistance TerB family protein n=1 Tax=Scandinavium goeteborgense TaxID=1851514 RepID=UPI002166A6AC|nr:tellurite resistance TerB family protein [Scandinavium goeteborgense]MCS2154746.1 tellurite resistance TerB family protein [Scandinavium goeteborgense]
MGFLKFGKKAAAAKAGLKKLENRDLMEAIVYGSVLVAAADGELEAPELARIEAIIQTNDKLNHFGGEASVLIAKCKDKFEEVGFGVLKMEAKRQISDVKSSEEEREEVFANIIAVAMADGEIEDSERKVLEEIGRLLNLRIEDWL